MWISFVLENLISNSTWKCTDKTTHRKLLFFLSTTFFSSACVACIAFKESNICHFSETQQNALFMVHRYSSSDKRFPGFR